MGITAAPYAHDFQGPDLIQQDAGGTLTCPVYDGDALAVPTSGTISIFKPGRVVLVDEAALSDFTGNVARYAVSSVVSAAQTLGMGYQVEWTLRGASWGPYTYRNEVGIVRCLPTPAATHLDMTRAHRKLSNALAGTGETTFQVWLDEAWRKLTRWLIGKGPRPHLIIEPWELKELHTAWAYWHFCADAADGAPETSIWHKRAKDAGDALQALQDTAAFRYDANDDGLVGEGEQPARPVLVLTSTTGRGWQAAGMDRY